MTERKDLFKSVPLDLSSTVKPAVRKNRVVMNQIFSSMMKQMIESPEGDVHPAEAIKRPALPDGTGRIINIGV